METTNEFPKAPGTIEADVVRDKTPKAQSALESILQFIRSLFGASPERVRSLEQEIDLLTKQLSGMKRDLQAATRMHISEKIRLESEVERLGTERHKLRRLTLVDPATGCLNKFGAEKYLTDLASALSRLRPENDAISWGIVLITIDGATPNDTLLQAIAYFLREIFKRSGDAIARIGNEYIVFLAAANLEGVNRRIEEKEFTRSLHWVMQHYDQQIASAGRHNLIMRTGRLSFPAQMVGHDGEWRSPKTVWKTLRDTLEYIRNTEELCACNIISFGGEKSCAIKQ